MHQLTLASESPRRKHLLLKAGYSFETFPVKVSEHIEKNLREKLSVDEQIQHLARKKAEAAFVAYNPLKAQNFLILSADTMVTLDNVNLGKPETSTEACLFLRQLSGRSHLVKTAICLIEGKWTSNGYERGQTLVGLTTTKVNFRELSDREIKDYVKSGEPMDKAGAYGIQGEGAKFISSIEGSYENIVGLPLELFSQLLATGGFEIQKLPRVLAVSKLQPVEKIRELYIVRGQRLFGENYAQEALPKIQQLKGLTEIEWHFIGRLQKNKLKHIVGPFQLIHSVDSYEIAEAINRIAERAGIRQDILLQVNLAEEKSKGGFLGLSDLIEIVGKMKLFKNIRVKGWMTMPPLFENPELARPYFKELCQIRERFLEDLPEAIELSMGTSSDHLIATEEGATIVRLGTLVFGERINSLKA